MRIGSSGDRMGGNHVLFYNVGLSLPKGNGIS